MSSRRVGRAPVSRSPSRRLPTGNSETATQENQCAAVSSIFQLSTERGSGLKLYTFELQDYADGWTECEKHFGLFDVAGNDKCAACVSCAQPL